MEVKVRQGEAMGTEANGLSEFPQAGPFEPLNNLREKIARKRRRERKKRSRKGVEKSRKMEGKR
jgi:hypothetical protein